LIAFAAELAYLAGRTLIRAGVQDAVLLELATTAWRILFVALYVWLFLDRLRAVWVAPARRSIHPLLGFGIAASILSIMTAGYWQNQDMTTVLVFALTTPVAAFREELFYRFILQDALERKMPPLAAVLLSSILFVMSHVGAQPMNFFSVVLLLSPGILLGVLYQRTRSLRLVVMLHLVINLAFLLSMKIISPTAAFLGYVGVIFIALLGWWLDNSRERRGG